MIISKFYKKIVTVLVLVFLSTIVVYAEETALADDELQVIELYIATFNRAPDKAGLDYWVGEMRKNSWKIDKVATSFFDQEETLTLYPSSLSTDEFIDRIYQNILNRASDEAGKDYWRGELDNDNISKQTFIIAILNGAKANNDALDDKQILTNKISAGIYFTVERELQDSQLAKDMMKAITIDVLSIGDAKNIVRTAEVKTVTPPDINMTNCQILKDNISVDTTLQGCYNVPNSISIESGVLLTIDQNSIFIFAQGTGLTINGALKAIGTRTQPVIFTGDQKTEGFWNRLYFSHSNDVRNQLSYCIIEYAGSQTYGAIESYGVNRLKFNTVLIKHSKGDGFEFSNATILDEFQGVISTKNLGIAGTLYPNNLSALDDSSYFLGNLGGDYVGLIGGAVTQDIIWNALTVPVLVKGNVQIADEKFLTIGKGARFLFEQGNELTVYGALKAVGTLTEPILFSGKQKTEGYWDRIYYSHSNDVRNDMAHCIIEYGGSETSGAIDSYGVNRLKIRDTLIQHSKGDGFDFSDATVIDQFKNVTSTKNMNTAGKLYANALDAVDDSSDFTGNIGGDYLTLSGGRVTKDATWNRLTVPVLVSANVQVDKEKLLTIDAGAKFSFAQDMELTIYGGLKAIGTEQEPIIFTGKQATVGYWDKIYFTHSNDIRNKMSYCTVEYANGSGAIDTYGTTILNVENSKFENNANYAIDLSSDTAFTESNNSFSNNQSGDINYP